MSKVIVTGAAGFIGSHLTDKLIELGHQVVGIDDLSRGRIENVNPDCEFYKASIADYESISSLFVGASHVFHLAALARVRPSVNQPLEYNRVNVQGTLNVLEASRIAKVGRFIFASSSSVFGDAPTPHAEKIDHNPKNPYALQKSIGEQYTNMYTELFGLPTVILRFFNVYGTRQIPGGAYSTVIGIFQKQKHEGKPLTIFGDGEQRRDFTHVRDTVDGIIKAMPAIGTFNLGRGQNRSVKEIADMISDNQVHLPAFKGEAQETLCDNSKAQNILGWNPKIDITPAILKEMEDYANFS